MSFWQRVMSIFSHQPAVVAPVITPVVPAPAYVAPPVPQYTATVEPYVAKVDTKGFVLSEDVKVPVQGKYTLDELLNYLNANGIEFAREYSHIVEFGTKHPELATPAAVLDGYKVSDERVKHMVTASDTEEPFQNGKFSVAELMQDGGVKASVYLNVWRGRYGAVTKRNIWIDMVRGPRRDVGAFIAVGGSTNAGMTGNWNDDDYHSDLKDAVEAAMRG